MITLAKQVEMLESDRAILRSVVEWVVNHEKERPGSVPPKILSEMEIALARTAEIP